MVTEIKYKKKIFIFEFSDFNDPKIKCNQIQQNNSRKYTINSLKEYFSIFYYSFIS